MDCGDMSLLSKARTCPRTPKNADATIGAPEMIIRARTVVTMEGRPVDNGAVAISEDRIADIAKFDQIKAHTAGEIVDLGERALLPGFINAHCHLDYTCLRGKISPQKSFADWIRAINAAKARLSPEDYLASINEGFAEAKRFGTTTIANLTAFPKLVPQIDPAIRTWWLAELIDVRAPERANEIVDSVVESLRSRPNWGLAPHALFTASKNLYHRCEQVAERENILVTTHLAESREEMEMFRDGSGPLYNFMKSIGRPVNDCGQATPLARFLDLTGRGGSPNRPQAIEVNRPYLPWIIAHLNELTESDFELLEKSNVQFHVVHCPRSHQYFRHSPFAFDRLRLLGLNICLGTDSLASNETLSLFDEMRAFQKQFPNVSAEKILQMVTVNAARSLRQENALGKMCRGARADLLAVPCTGGDVFEEVIAFAGEPWMMVAGEVQHDT
jgi:cytosine/adenosine deaminase-related metal-dependent hydrolase